MKKVLFLLLIPSLAFAATWTAKVVGTSSDNQGNQIVSLHFSSDKGGTYDVDDRIPLGAPGTQLGDFVASVINSLNAQSIAFSSAPTAGQDVLPTPSPIPIIDPNAAIKSQFLADYLLLKEMQAAVSHQLMTAGDLSLAAQLTTVTNELAANKSILLPLIQTGP